MKIDGFDWDAGNRTKCGRHGILLEDIEHLFSLPHRIAPDVKHSDEEERFLAIGRHRDGHPMFVVFTTRHVEGKLMVRPISARYMHDKEFKRYDR